MDGTRRRLAIVGIEQHPIGQVLHALGDPLELAVERLGDAGPETELGDLAGRVALDQPQVWLEKVGSDAKLFGGTRGTRGGASPRLRLAGRRR